MVVRLRGVVAGGGQGEMGALSGSDLAVRWALLHVHAGLLLLLWFPSFSIPTKQALHQVLPLLPSSDHFAGRKPLLTKPWTCC